MEPPLSIEEASQRTGLSAHTLRYYERIGLIAAVARAAGGQRRYAAADLAWLAFLTRLRTTRMPIQKMRLFAQLRSTGDATVPARRAMLQTHLAEVQAEITAMQQAAQALQDKIAHYQALESADSAPPRKNAAPKKDPNHG
ncbi:MULTISPECIES: MerR family transcriptional regulator [Comamonas]|jgi:DNA-binding transcriptional MerR regulator|uniref:MerR family transcriptional regulator n=1 Tax=Comamonas TaxID=283 RepID=UPI0015F8F8E9|nr:MerR family transcriptional regulator [Comamonas koreensis]